MSAEAVETWLKSRKYAQIDGKRLKPLPHRALKGMPMAVQRGQAEVFFLLADDGKQWIIKKFHQGRCPEESYLKSVSRMLPKHKGFRSGINRRVLTAKHLKKISGCYYSRNLLQWLDGSILMPRIKGMDWAAVADEIRDGDRQLEYEQRLLLCRNLSELVCLLENNQCAHRDLSSGNTFIIPDTWEVALIDFDCFYPPSLSMPKSTTCGTEGYIPKFVWHNGTPSLNVTWCHYADRFSLALLNTEFLVLDKGTSLRADGGMFDQDELRARSGKIIRHTVKKLKSEYPEAASLFRAAINSRSYVDCPSPQDWIAFCDSYCATKQPLLRRLEEITPTYFYRQLQQRKRVEPTWSAPRLDDLPKDPIRLWQKQRQIVSLPLDPWRP